MTHFRWFHISDLFDRCVHLIVIRTEEFLDDIRDVEELPDCKIMTKAGKIISPGDLLKCGRYLAAYGPLDRKHRENLFRQIQDNLQTQAVRQIASAKEFLGV